MRRKSPTSLKVAFAQMRRGRTLSLTDALKLEFRLASQLIGRPDYREGIASRMVGKGTEPRWSPDTLAEVSDAEIDEMFATPADCELILETREFLPAESADK